MAGHHGGGGSHAQGRTEYGTSDGGSYRERQENTTKERIRKETGADRRSDDASLTRERVETQTQERVRSEEQAGPGFEKQGEKKAEQTRKEEGRGSETGQTQREEHSRKWWQFWK